MAAAQKQAIARRATTGPETTIVLGGSTEAFSEYHQEKGAFIETQDAPHRFQQAPGGSSSICLGYGGAGLTDTVLATPTKRPGGGAATIVLGDGETPEAPNRFTQAPGGKATVVLGGAVVQKPHDPLRQAPGGPATIVLGGDLTDPHDTFSATSSDHFASGTNLKFRNTVSDESTTRLHHAGGTSTICLGDDSVSSMLLRKPTSHMSKSPDPIQAAPTPSRLQRSPGGKATICFGGDANDPFNTHNVSSNKFADGAHQNCGNTITDRSTTRLHHAPGGASTLTFDSCLSDVESTPLRKPMSHVSKSPDPQTIVTQAVPTSSRLRRSPGGEATICFGGDIDDPFNTHKVSSNKFADGAHQNCGNTITDRPTTRLHHAPGGASALTFGNGDVDSCPPVVESAPLRKPMRDVSKSPDPQTIVTQAAPTSSRLRRSPGGEATICFGGDTDDPFDTHKVSSNKFADGAHQNCGDTITDRPTTRLHHVPGGASTLTFGSDEVDSSVARTVQTTTAVAGPHHVAASLSVGVRCSSNRFASGANQNCRNVITDRPSTRLHHAPGGASTLSLGNDDVESSAVKTKAESSACTHDAMASASP